MKDIRNINIKREYEGSELTQAQDVLRNKEISSRDNCWGKGKEMK